MVQNYIREQIIKEKLESGDPLPPEGKIASELNVSRGSVREAVKILSTLGIVEVRHGDGLFVRGMNLDAVLDVLSFGIMFDPSSLLELVQIRRIMESSLIPEILPIINKEDLARCSELLDKWEENIDKGIAFAEQDQLFHLSLYRAFGNQLLLKLIKVFWLAYQNAEATLPKVSWRTMSLEEKKMGLKEHREILSAIEAKDGELAKRLIVDHFTGIKKKLREVLEKV